MNPEDETAASEPKTELDLLREEVAFLKGCGVIELAVRNPSVADYMAHWEGRAEKAEAESQRLSTELQELRAALRPFAEIEPTNVYSGDPDDPDAEAATLLTENQFRRARAALKPEPIK